ncbi:hypothetical protein [Catellatospora aurea]|uniref:hypothetical protein n=1 Tax=Catellatospora aurea TaxID=1337874 RepID=UPI003A931C82
MAVSLLAAGTGTGGATAASPPAASAPLGRPAAAQPRTVTLVTGDQVTSYGSGHIAVAPRDGVRFLRYAVADHRYVIPSDALPLLRSDRLDRRLFDVTALLEAGYDKHASLGLVVSGVTGDSAAAPRELKSIRKLAAVRGYTAKVGKEKLAAYWKSLTSSVAVKSGSQGKVWLDGLRKPTLDASTAQIGAPSAWSAGFDGTGVTVSGAGHGNRHHSSGLDGQGHLAP